MPIEHTKTGATVITGKGIDLFRLISLKSALKLEQHGIKVRRGFSARKYAQEELKTKVKDYPTLISMVEALIEAQRAKVTIIQDLTTDVTEE